MKPTDELIADICKTDLTWMVTRGDPKMFEVVFGGEHFQLRLNDFPEEPICTLFVRDRELDLEEAPRLWHLKH